MVERIRRLCMERIKDSRLAIGTKPGPLCHRINKILEKRICFADGMSYSWNGLDGFEIFSHNGEQFKVDLKKRECSCRLKLSRKKDITKVHRVKGKEKLTRWHSQTYKYCEITGHNVRTCVKKKVDTEGNRGHPKKCTRATKKTADTEMHNNHNVVTEEDVLAHEAYLHNLYDWLNGMKNIVPTFQVAQHGEPSQSRKKQLSQPILPSQTSTEVPKVTCSQSNLPTTTNTKKMDIFKRKSSSTDA
ncbi:hypothetical protein LIER_41235 [Lithospermum erythrorhizon]|uniref:Uncharacterized protein n=1 Tax=Lithospermum erythrorhizon TaxID=34254 RepID=A0AAV3RA26_LITER